MRKLSIEECKELSLKVLIDVAKYCEDNNITYFLACGTLLGAIRHKGFIPWDDDIDIMMPRPDYDRLLNEFDLKGYIVLKPSDGLFPYAKIFLSNTVKYESGYENKNKKTYGIDIDIFPLDGSIDDEDKVLKQYQKQYFIETLINLSKQPIGIKKSLRTRINRIIPRIIGTKNLIKLAEKNAKKYRYEDSDYVVRMKASSNGFTGSLPKEIYEKDYKEFEGYKFCVPKGYDIWLTSFFGDYMTPTPVEKRFSHNYEAYIDED